MQRRYALKLCESRKDFGKIGSFNKKRINDCVTRTLFEKFRVLIVS